MSLARDKAPTPYACGKLQRMEDNWNGSVGFYVRRYGPMIWGPYVPPQALQAMGANSGSTADDVTSESLGHEIGFFDTPAGQTPTYGGAWNRIATSQAFRNAARRAGYVGPNWANAVEDQVVIGLLDYLQHGDHVVANIPAAIRPSSKQTLWFYFLACAGYVTGGGAPITLANRYLTELSAVPESQRVAMFLSMVANDPTIVSHTAGGDRSSLAYPITRAWERLETGRLLASVTGGDTSWFDLGLGASRPAIEWAVTTKWLTDAGGPPDPRVYEQCHGIAMPRDTTPDNSGSLGDVVAVSAVAYGGWWIGRQMKFW